MINNIKTIVYHRTILVSLIVLILGFDLSQTFYLLPFQNPELIDPSSVYIRNMVMRTNYQMTG
jgi:hypothetical protein